jgi:hypothetical protein
MVGHIHLSTNVYADIYEILASIGMNLIVAAGFIHDFIEYKKEKTNKNKQNAKSTTTNEH